MKGAEKMQTIVNSLLFLRRWAQALGPYLLLELLLPGGTLLALTLFLYRNRKLGVGAVGWNPLLPRVMSISAVAKRL
jgi:hypothetical protein